jgi:hypothetical protein
MSKPTLLALLALPAGAIGYAIATAVVSGVGLPDGARDLLLLIVPLFVAGLCMVPFVLPLFDRMAKRDLAAHGAQHEPEAVEPADGDQPPH